MRLLLFFCVVLSSSVCLANADTIEVYSNAMKKNVKTVVVTPRNYKKAKNSFPVVYLLHGYSGSYSNWISRVPVIDSLSEVYQLIIVCPDAAYSSWYFDSPVDSTFRYETFTGVELPQFIDANYKTIRHKKARAISGLSMGGHGAMFLGLRHPQTFGAIGSMSGALDISYITQGYDMQKRLGDTLTNRSYYKDWSVVSLLDKYDKKDSLAMIIDCGINDFIIGMSRSAHEKMLKLKIPHDYIERPGAHDWKYWNTAIRYQLLYFREYFNRNK